MQLNIEKRLATKLGISQAKADEFFNATIEAIAEELAVDPDLRIANFGRFKITKVDGYLVNLPDGSVIDVPDHSRVSFTAYGPLKVAAANHLKEEE